MVCAEGQSLNILPKSQGINIIYSNCCDSVLVLTHAIHIIVVPYSKVPYIMHVPVHVHNTYIIVVCNRVRNHYGSSK